MTVGTGLSAPEGTRTVRICDPPAFDTVGDADHCVPRADVVIGPYTHAPWAECQWQGRTANGRPYGALTQTTPYPPRTTQIIIRKE